MQATFSMYRKGAPPSCKVLLKSSRHHLSARLENQAFLFTSTKN